MANPSNQQNRRNEPAKRNPAQAPAPVQPVTVPVGEGQKEAVEVHQAIADQAGTKEYQAMTAPDTSTQRGKEGEGVSGQESPEKPAAGVSAARKAAVVGEGQAILQEGEHAKTDWTDPHPDSTQQIIVNRTIVRQVYPPNCTTPVTLLVVREGTEMTKSEYNKLVG